MIQDLHSIPLRMHLPEQLINSLQQVKGFNEQAFIDVHENPEKITSIRINPKKHLENADANLLPPVSVSETVNDHDKVPWSSHGYYLDERPSFTFDPLFHAGLYYVQEASSMFLGTGIETNG